MFNNILWGFMLVYVLLGLGSILLLFLGFISTRESRFHYERSGVIEASAEKIFPYLANFKLGHLWSPYEKVDPNMKKSFYGDDGQPGAGMEFDGNRDAGSGWLEILKIVPNESVEIKLVMTKPFKADNLVIYKLTPEGQETRFTWSMSGDGGFTGKLLNFFVDCEKMVADQFSAGIANLKAVIEAQK